MKPCIFVGSSVEHLSVAYAIQKNLEHDADVTVWTQGVFKLSRSTLEQLMALLRTFDFAVFVFAPDDLLMMRSNRLEVARDNVVFELGLFMGALGRDRVFFVTPRAAGKLHIPTDLLGITPATYDPSRDNKTAALGSACTDIRASISSCGLRNRTRIKEAVVNRCAISIEAGDLLTYCGKREVVCAFPTNVFFDTTAQQNLVDRSRSAFGKYLASRVDKDSLAAFDEDVASALTSQPSLTLDGDQAALPAKAGRAKAYKLGTALVVSRPKGERVILLSATRVNKQLKSVTDSRLLLSTLDEFFRQLGELPDVHSLALPLVGSGLGRVPANDALAMMLTALRDGALRARPVLCREVKIIVYGAPHLPDWAIATFDGLLATDA